MARLVLIVLILALLVAIPAAFVSNEVSIKDMFVALDATSSTMFEPATINLEPCGTTISLHIFISSVSLHLACVRVISIPVSRTDVGVICIAQFECSSSKPTTAILF